MRTILAAIVFLALGIGVGMLTSYRNFVGEQLPTKAFLAYFEQQRSPDAIPTGPRLVMPKGETYDFGSLPLWAKRKYEFVVRNEGTATLQLVMGKPTCSCTAGASGGKPMKEGDVMEVPPKQERPFVLEWEIKSSIETFNQSAPFTTNDPQRPNLTLSIVGRVEEAVRRSREAIIFSNVTASATLTEMVRLDTKQSNDFAIVSHRWLQPQIAGFFDVRIEPLSVEEAAKIGPGVTSIAVHVTLKPGLPLGRFDQTLELTSNKAPEIPPIQVPIRGSIVGDISLFGLGVNADSRSVPLGVVKHGVGAKRTIYLRVKGPHRDETQFSIKSVEPASLMVRLRDADTSKPHIRMYPLDLEVPADHPLINLSGSEEGRTGRIVLETTHPTIKQLELQVFFLVRE